MTRLELHKRLSAILGSNFVYYQPPASYKIKYPCIIYRLAPYEAVHADDMPYHLHEHYTITHITKDPHSITPKVLAEQPMCKHQQSFVTDNLYHNVYDMYI